MIAKRATAKLNVVTTDDNKPVDDIQIIGQAKGESSGWAIFDGEKCFYVPDTQPDLIRALDDVVALLDQVFQFLSDVSVTISTKPTGTPGSPLDATWEVTKALPIKNSLTQLKSTINALKGGLI